MFVVEVLYSVSIACAIKKKKGNLKYDIGYGKEVWPDGTVHEGFYINGKKNGKGKITFSDKAWYEGEFLDNSIHGNGFYVWSDGKKHKGTWVKNKMQGRGMGLMKEE